MSMNEADTRYHLIDPVLRDKGYVSRDRITLETVLTPPPVEPSGPKGRRRKGPGRTDYLLCVQVGDAPKPMPVAVLEAKKEADDPLKGMQQARGYADTLRFDVKYVFSTHGHRYGEYDRFTELINGPFAFSDFPSHAELTARYGKDTGIDLTQPGSAMLFQADSAAWSQSRYYQDAAIRAAFEKILLDRQAGKPPRVLLTLATGAGKTIIATNLLWRLSQAGQLPKPALFLCDRDELREQATTKLKAAFGDNARIVRTERGGNAAANARIHIATYQTLGLDDGEPGDGGFASFLTEHDGEDAFSVIIIDECHRSAWGRWSEVLRRHPGAIHIGLTATPRQLGVGLRGARGVGSAGIGVAHRGLRVDRDAAIHALFRPEAKLGKASFRCWTLIRLNPLESLPVGKRGHHDHRPVGFRRAGRPAPGRGQGHRLPLARAPGLPAHRVGRLWKFKLSEVDDWVRAGGADDEQGAGGNNARKN